MKRDKKELILNTLRDLMVNFLYYDRKEDDDLPVGAIEKAIKKGKITIAEMVDLFRNELEESVES